MKSIDQSLLEARSPKFLEKIISGPKKSNFKKKSIINKADEFQEFVLRRRSSHSLHKNFSKAVPVNWYRHFFQQREQRVLLYVRNLTGLHSTKESPRQLCLEHYFSTYRSKIVLVVSSMINAALLNRTVEPERFTQPRSLCQFITK